MCILSFCVYFIVSDYSDVTTQNKMSVIPKAFSFYMFHSIYPNADSMPSIWSPNILYTSSYDMGIVKYKYNNRTTTHNIPKSCL